MEERHLSQQDVSRLSGIPQPTISKLLGGNATFTVDHLLALSRALDIEAITSAHDVGTAAHQGAGGRALPAVRDSLCVAALTPDTTKAAPPSS